MIREHRLISGIVGAVLAALIFVMAQPVVANAAAAVLRVIVENTAANPVPIRDIDSVARQIYQANYGGILNNGEANGCVVLFDVPAGKRLVIEHATLNAFAPPGQELLFQLVVTNGGFDEYVHYTINAHRPTGGSLYVASDPVKAYGGPASQVCVSAQRNATAGLVSVGFAASGYMIDAP